MRTGERVSGFKSLAYIVLCISEKSFGTVVIVPVLGCRGDECARETYWEYHSHLYILFMWEDAVEYLRKKHGALSLLYSFVGLQWKTARAFSIFLPSCW